MSPSMRERLNETRRALGRQLSRTDFRKHGKLKSVHADDFWKRGGYVIAYLPNGYKLACNRDGTLYVIKCHLAMPVTCSQRVRQTMRQEFSQWL